MLAHADRGLQSLKLPRQRLERASWQPCISKLLLQTQNIVPAQLPVETSFESSFRSDALGPDVEPLLLLLLGLRWLLVLLDHDCFVFKIIKLVI